MFINRPHPGAFLFPYLIMLLLLGIPLFYLELTLGQGTRKGPVGAWKKVAPNLLGVGIAAAIVNSYICLYYNVIIAWVIYYFFSSFTAFLPWGNCFGHVVLGLNSTQRMDLLSNNTGLDWSSCFNSSSEWVSSVCAQVYMCVYTVCVCFLARSVCVWGVCVALFCYRYGYVILV